MLALREISRHRVLVVDDESGIRLLLRRLIEAEGQEAICVTNGNEALQAIEQALPDLVLLDVDMPHMGGFDVCRMIKADPRTRLIPVVILAGSSESETRLRAWELGADDFILKPFRGVEVTARCRSLLRVKDLVDELDGTQSVVFALARAIEAKSPYTQGHSERVAHYAQALAARLGLPEAERELLNLGAALHDIGKIAVPDGILNKPALLTADEYDQVKQHPIAGIHIIEPLRSVRGAVPLIRWHHERLDGRGYPDGLSGSAIPLLVRILSIADICDALTSPRPYRPALTFQASLNLLQENAAGGGVDTELTRLFAELPDSAVLARAAQSIS
jgi:putative two-component system response regulator